MTLCKARTSYSWNHSIKLDALVNQDNYAAPTKSPVCGQMAFSKSRGLPESIPSLAQPPPALLNFCSCSKLHVQVRMWKSSLYGNACYTGYCIGKFQKISIPNHKRLPCSNPLLPSEIPKCIIPPCPQNSIIMNPLPLPFRNSVCFWKYIFNSATALWTNEHKFMHPQGCDLATPGHKLYFPVTRKTYR